MAPRAYWRGYLKVSLVSCPVALFPESTERDAEAVERTVRERAMRGYVQPRKRKGKLKLYIIRADNSTRFKIGIAVNPTSRLSDLRVGSSLPLELIATSEIASPQMERDAHRLLAPWRSHGEVVRFRAGHRRLPSTSAQRWFKAHRRPERANHEIIGDGLVYAAGVNAQRAEIGLNF